MKAIDYKLNKFRIQNIDNTSMTLDLSKFEFALKNEIKETIICMAKEKNILTSN